MQATKKLKKRLTVQLTDLDELVIFIYDGAPAHNNPAIPSPNSELKKLPPYSPFLNIVEQAIIALKAVKKLKDN